MFLVLHPTPPSASSTISRQSRIDRHVIVKKAVPNHSLRQDRRPVYRTQRIGAFLQPGGPQAPEGPPAPHTPRDEAAAITTRKRPAASALEADTNQEIEEDDVVEISPDSDNAEDDVQSTDSGECEGAQPPPHRLPEWFLAEHALIEASLRPLIPEVAPWENDPLAVYHVNLAGNGDDPNEHGQSPYTVDPTLAHITTLSIRDFYNFGDVRFRKQAPGAAKARAYYESHAPFAQLRSHPSTEPRLRATADVDPVALHRLVTLHSRMPFEDREPSGETIPAQPRRIKQRVTEVPGPAERFRMWISPPHSTSWFHDKSISDGATTLAVVQGVSKFDQNDSMWQVEHGLLAKDEQNGEDLFPLHNGTYFETETCWVASYLLGIFANGACGMIPDSTIVHSRMSPDRLCVVPPWIAWNRWMLQRRRERRGDFLRRLLIEAKSPIHAVYTFGEISTKWVYRHYVPVMYRPQTTDQMQKADLPGNLFAAYWHQNAKSPMRRVAGTDVFMVSEMLITLILRNDAYAEVSYTALKEHVAATTCPPRLKPGDLPVPKLSMVPIVHARFFIEGERGGGETPPLTPGWIPSSVNHPCAPTAGGVGGGASHLLSPLYLCECCKTGTKQEIHRLAVPWDQVRWTQRLRTDPNVGVRPPAWIWPNAWYWPPRMGSHIQWFHDAEPVAL